MTRRLILLFALGILVLGLLAAPAFGQDPYSDEDAEVMPLEVTAPPADAQAQVSQIPVTGGDFGALAIAGVVLTGIGGATLLVVRSRRSHG